MSSPLADIQGYSAFVYSLRERHRFITASVLSTEAAPDESEITCESA